MTIKNSMGSLLKRSAPVKRRLSAGTWTTWVFALLFFSADSFCQTWQGCGNSKETALLQIESKMADASDTHYVSGSEQLQQNQYREKIREESDLTIDKPIQISRVYSKNNLVCVEVQY